MSSSYQHLPTTTYGSTSTSMRSIPGQIPEGEAVLDDEGGDFEQQPPFGGSSFRIMSERFTPLVRNMSIQAEQVIQENFTPLYRTVSEGVQTLAHPSFVLPEKALDPAEDRHKYAATKSGGTSSIPSEIANLSKNTIGGGVMSLSGGIALFANDPRAVGYAAGWILLLGLLFGYFCLLTGKSCEMSLSATYRECWERTVGRKGGIFVATATTLDPLMGLMANSAILSQSLRFTLRGLLGLELSIPECLSLLAVVALLPLCLMRNLDALAPFSALGMGAVFLTLACMTLRYLDGSYLPGGAYHDEILTDYQPLFGDDCRPFSFSVMPFVCMAFTSFDMHYASPRFYTELKDASVPRFAAVCASSFGIVSFLYLSIAVVGFLTFGGHADSFILDNYSSHDPLATVARMSMGVSALLTYPLNFMGLRDNLLDLLGLTDEFQTLGKKRVYIVLLLACVVTMACFVTDLGLISSVGGGTSVALVAFVFPAIMFKEAVKQYYNNNNNNNLSFVDNPDEMKHHDSSSKWARIEVWFVMVSMIAMVILGISGVIASIALGA